ncbi:MAG TPA: dienelactone hydrolase family protein [Gemmatimonadales bacterium]|nr:dienelactone hydrolase family protein [Gemmatimonadales bacterium]
MASRADRRSGGLAVGFSGGAALALAAVFLSARPPDRLTADIHAEYVKYASGRDTITAYVAYPERRDPAPAVVVIHEIFGLSDFIRQTTEQLAKDGFVAIAPDLLSRRGGTPAATDEARRLIGGLNADTLTLDLDATVAYVKTLKAARGDRVGVIGFCWGGGQSFRYATSNPSLRAFVVCYGPGPDTAAIARIRARGLGVYAEQDARINAGLPDVDAAVRRYRTDYRYTVYPGVGHGFLRAREKPEVADSAWGNVVRFFRESLER